MSYTVDEYRREISSKKILVVGMGRSGVAAVKELHILGATVTAQDINTVDKIDPKFITFLDREGIDYYFGSTPEHIDYFDVVVLSPGVNPSLEFLNEGRNKGVEIIGELEMAYRLSRGKYVAITGTNGKTTTTSLVGKIFEESGRKYTVVGNIGVATISKVQESTDDEWMIVEASSFQLETISQFRPMVSAILNFTPDHLNRHGSMEAYGACKAAIGSNQTADDYMIINYDDKACLTLASDINAKLVPFSRLELLNFGAYIDDGYIVIKDESGIVHQICSRDELKIIGNHNLENALAAAAVSFFAGIDTEVIAEAIKKFPGVEHRIEYCGIVDGVKFYNDSKGTNVDASVIALKALEPDIILIAGGDGKAQDFTELGESLAGRAKALILLGRDAKEIEKAARAAGFSKIYLESDMNDCVKRAHEISVEADKVLLSPACASWDMYDSYEQRGEHFKNCVNQLLR
nr:UDP-N-acetylmuramoyl-L-alanine--D-glutamate ligase [uncultured Mogibacterium sp.]